MTDNTIPTTPTTREARQRRTVLGFLEDLRAKIEDRRSCCAALQADLDQVTTELKTLELLLAEWDDKVHAHIHPNGENI
jgi:hypothetical protein